MEEELYGVHSEDDKALPENNKKRKVKTPAQVEALEKLYNEHKYPTESIKLQLAESTGLTEKQISGWFCHRRLKDKRLSNEKTYAFGKQDHSNRVIQDRGSGHRQDSCGSTKQGDDRNSETREVESGRLPGQELSAAELTYEHGSHHAGNYDRRDDESSESSSLLRNISSQHNGDPSDKATSRYPTPMDAKPLKTRRRPSGYLKVKNRVENTAITAVKQQLGMHYREDGPPLGIEFDPLPFGAFESSAQDPVNEPYYDGEPVLQASPDDSKIQRRPNFCKGYDHSSSAVALKSNVDRTSSKLRHGSDIPQNNFREKFRPIEGFARDRPGWKGWDNYQMKPYEDYIEHESSNLTMKGKEHHYYTDKGLSRRMFKNGSDFGELRAVNDNSEPSHVMMTTKSELRAAKRAKSEFLQQHAKRSSMLDTQPWPHHVMRSAVKKAPSSSEEDRSADTS